MRLVFFDATFPVVVVFKIFVFVVNDFLESCVLLLFTHLKENKKTTTKVSMKQFTYKTIVWVPPTSQLSPQTLSIIALR